MPESAAGHSPARTPETTRDTPGNPVELGHGGWLAAGRRTGREFKEDNLRDWAAALTYYSIQSIFPGLLVLVSLLGLIGKSATQPFVTGLAKLVPANVRTILLDAITHLQQHRGAAGILTVVSIALGLWSASNYVAAFMRASNAIYDVPEGRPAWKAYPIRVGITIAMLVLLVASVLIVVVTGSLARRAGNGLGMFGILYWASPNARQGFRWVFPGGLLAVILWLIASGLFALYVANFSHYNKVYGSLGGIIIFLIWMWLSNIAILFGAEFNAELIRGRAIAAGAPPGQEPYTELRDTRKLDKQLGRRTAG
jgi:membrane protein